MSATAEGEDIKEDDWGLSLDFNLFAQHERYRVHRQKDDFFWLECVESLTPLDMMNLTNGIHDATCHCAWTGAFLLVSAIASGNETLASCLNDKRVLELGAGSGVAGLGLLPTNPATRSDDKTNQKIIEASFCCFTDADPEALRLCRRNCEINKVPPSRFDIATHVWGTPFDQGNQFGKGEENQSTATAATLQTPQQSQQNTYFDAVIAADVLYDIGMLHAILESATTALTPTHERKSPHEDRGYFILSHVPRACYNSENPPPKAGSGTPLENLERFIVQEATTHGFVLETLIRPLDLIGKEETKSNSIFSPELFPSDALNNMPFDEMQAVGAAILVFALPRKPHDTQTSDERIVAFDNRHFVWKKCSESGSDVFDFLHEETGWPRDLLEIQQENDTYISVRAKSRILGGKGGFGSLLKSQSRQAGARSTTNFGACRDLQGRRLRHVNDAVTAARVKEWKDKIAAGQATEMDQAKALVMDTESQVPGWYLQLPSWSDVSKKEHRRWKRQFQLWKRDQDMEQQWKEQEKQRKEARINHYVDKAEEASDAARSSVQSAIAEGLKKKKELESVVERDTSKSKRSKQQPDPPTALLTLSGDVVLAYENDSWQVQSQSNFCTFGVVLQPELIQQCLVDKKDGLYWEAKLITGGLSQIGWGEPDPQRFRPNSETGDGVGDDTASFSYDGSRGIVLHKSESKAYGNGAGKTLWKAGDVVGCMYNMNTGSISFSLNGTSLGKAYQVESHGSSSNQDIGGDSSREPLPYKVLFPAASCNPKEILELRLKESEMSFKPENALAVGEALATEDIQFERQSQEESEVNPGSKEETPATESSNARRESKVEDGKVSAKSAMTSEDEAAPIDLDEYQSAAELQPLGLNRLKAALQVRGLKCGGRLEERAERLFSVKGMKPEQYPAKLLAKKKS